MNRTLLRIGVVTLPALLLVSSLAAVAIAFPAWGAGNHAGLSSWMPTAAGIFIGLPGAVIAVLCLQAVLHSTRGPFTVAPLILSFGLLTMPIGIATETAIAIGVADAGTYDRLLEPERERPPGLTFDGPPPEGPVSPAGFLVGSFVIGLFVNGIVAISTVTYVSGITAGTKRFERQPDEYDAVAEMLRGHHGPGAPLP